MSYDSNNSGEKCRGITLKTCMTLVHVSNNLSENVVHQPFFSLDNENWQKNRASKCMFNIKEVYLFEVPQHHLEG